MYYKVLRSDLNVLHLDIMTLPSKCEKLKIFLAELQKDTNPDVILLCETWLP